MREINEYWDFEFLDDLLNNLKINKILHYFDMFRIVWVFDFVSVFKYHLEYCIPAHASPQSPRSDAKSSFAGISTEQSRLAPIFFDTEIS